MATTEAPMIHHAMRDPFRQFSRNGRWGTCAECPRDADGNAYPESCMNTQRGDHHLNVDQLTEQHKGYLT